MRDFDERSHGHGLATFASAPVALAALHMFEQPSLVKVQEFRPEGGRWAVISERFPGSVLLSRSHADCQRLPRFLS
jgi:hypothetical protein